MLHFERAGEGVPLLLLHGFPLSSEAFWPQLATPPAGVQIIAPDLRGFGRSPPLTDDAPLTMEALAEDVLALMTALGLPSAFIGGVSMGGYVSMALTRLDPGRVRGLVLVDTQSFADDEAGQARREATAQDVLARGLGPLTESMLPRLLSPHAPADTRARVEKIMRGVPPKTAAAASRGMALRTDAKDILSRFGGPALVVVGNEDVVTPIDKAKTLVDLVAGARLEVLLQAGHLANLEQPEAFNAVLERFLVDPK